jgi:hypothetical protein
MYAQEALYVIRVRGARGLRFLDVVRVGGALSFVSDTQVRVGGACGPCILEAHED